MDFEKLEGYHLVHIEDDQRNVLREKREVLKLTQQQVANRANVKLIQYQRFEMGTRNIMNASFNLACRIIEALEMDISDFYHGNYILGEEVTFSKEGLRLKKNNRLIKDIN